jgi:ubiquinone/menaquinone biosynthesis C-methylase UbiE
MNIKEQGISADTIFHGEVTLEAVRLVYKESASLFSSLIRECLPQGNYEMADLGSHKGGFLKDLTELLPEYKFHTIAVDVNEDDLKVNIADQKIQSSLLQLSIENKSIDVTLARYVIAWNTLEQQKEILKEISRITKRIAIIQHQGANSNNPTELQNASIELFNGVVPLLKRENFFFSTSAQLEEYMRELNIKFKNVQHQNVKGLSDILIEKYKLSENDIQKVKQILKNSDYVDQTTWVLEF